MAEIEWHRAQQLTPQSLSNTAYTAISGVALAAGDLVDGDDYLLIVTAQLLGGNGNTRQARLVHGSTPFAESEQTDTGAADVSHCYQFFTVWEAVSGEGITLEGRVSASGSGTIDQVDLIAINLSDLTENTDWWFNQRSTDDALSTTPTNGATATLTPGGAGNYLVLAYSQTQTGGTSTSVITQLVRSGEASSSTPSAQVENAVSPSGLIGALLSRVFALTAVSNTFTEAAAMTSGTAHTRLHSSLLVLRLGAFAQSFSAYTEADENLGTSDYATQLQTAAVTPDLTGDWIIGAFWGWDGANVSRTAKWRVQVENSDSPAGQTTDARNFYVRDATDERPMTMVQVAELSSGASRTIDLDASVSSTTSTPSGQHRSLWGFSLELGGGEEQLPPTITPDTVDDETFTTDTPTLLFTGTDPNTVPDDLTYQVQITDNPDGFTGGAILQDEHNTGSGASFHPNPISGLTWLGDQQIDDRPGQSFTGGGGVLDTIRIFMSRDEADTDGTAYVRVYAHAGTFGTSSTPANPAADEDTPTPDWLAISDGVPLDGTMSASSLWYDFEFTGANRIRLEDGTRYMLIFDWVPNGTSEPPTNTVDLVGDSGLGHAGNMYIDGDSANHGVFGSADLLFEVLEAFVLLDQISDADPGFANEDNGGDTDPFTSGDQVSFTVQSGDELPDAVYYWRARVTDPAGTNTFSDWTTTRSFTVIFSESLVVNHPVQEHTADSPALVQQHLLGANDAAQASNADSPALVQAFVLVIADAVQAHSADAPSLITDGNLTLVVADAVQASLADSPALLQQFLLAVNDAIQASNADQVNFGPAILMVGMAFAFKRRSLSFSLTQRSVAFALNE